MEEAYIELLKEKINQTEDPFIKEVLSKPIPVKAIHMSKYTYVCPICGKILANRGNYC